MSLLEKFLAFFEIRPGLTGCGFGRSLRERPIHHDVVDVMEAPAAWGLRGNGPRASE